MKPKHLAIRIEQCLALSKASNCPRRKFGALLLDPTRNVILVDGYNGGPRGGGELCGDILGVNLCLRDGLRHGDLVVKPDGGSEIEDCWLELRGHPLPHPGGRTLYWRSEAEALRESLLQKHPPVQSGTRMEIGCHHSEMNVICNAAAGGTRTAAAWLIVTGEPCLMCSKLIHHAGIAKVIVVGGGYIGENGLDYLRQHGVEVETVEGPPDPRAAV